MTPGSSKPTIVVTGADLAPQALELLEKFDVVFAGKTRRSSPLHSSFDTARCRRV